MNSDQKLEALQAFLKLRRQYEDEKKMVSNEIKEDDQKIEHIIDEGGDINQCQFILNGMRRHAFRRKELSTMIKGVNNQMYALIGGEGEYDEDQADIYDVINNDLLPDEEEAS